MVNGLNIIAKAIYKIRAIAILLLLCFNSSCVDRKDDARKYLPGQYFYEIPSGELQVLKINPDFTFKQIIYSKNSKSVLYENIGKMFVEGRDIEFKNWLECYELADQKLLTTPHLVYSIGNYWKKNQGNDDITIIKFDQTNYIFKKKNTLF